MAVEKDYFEARFDGLEKLMNTQEGNLKGYISAVSDNVKTVRKELQDHKDNGDAHGLGAREKNGSSIAGWLGLVSGAVGIVAGVAVALWKHG